jgi:PAS domain S-box-containing protein
MYAPPGLLESLLNSSVDGVICADESQTIRLFSVGAQRLFGYSAADAIGQKLDMLLPQGVIEAHGVHVERFARSDDQARRMGERSPVRGRRKDGSEFPADVSISKFVSADGLVLTAVLRDISDGVAAARRLEDSEALLRLAQGAGGVGAWEWSLVEDTGIWTDVARRIFRPGGSEGVNFDLWRSCLHPDDRDRAVEAARRSAGSGEAYHDEFRVLHPDGAVHWVRVAGEVAHDAKGRPATMRGIVVDISERKRLEIERALDQQRIRIIYDQSLEFLGLLDADGILLEANRSALSFIDMTLDEVAGAPFWETPWWEGDESSRERLRDAIKLGAKGEFCRFDAIHTNRNGGRMNVDFSLTPVLDEESRVKWLLPEGRDVTNYLETERVLEARVAERTAALRGEMARREDMQATLAEAQRLEAIGKLTGGVAHDANNMLSVIGGNLEMLEDAIGSLEPGLTYLREAQAAVERMTQLNRRLLTVARRRKLEPRILDLNQQVAGMSEMLRRVLGETITLTTTLSTDIWKVALDAGELDAALLNLAINARDAMPRGGRLHISTKNVEIDEAAALGESDLTSGAYVGISVSDSGEGIPPEIVPRVFEPFFTTKGQGKGTGLGLATVHGFTKQSGGHVTIYSELGRGTTVTIYFPRHVGDGDASGQVQPSPRDVASGSGEVVLVVEDDMQVRTITCARLRRLGYRAIEAPDGPTALALLQRGEHVDVVFSDIIMSGGMTGFDLMSALEKVAPSVPVMLTSGFDLDAVRNGERQFSAKVLQKPYSQQDLAKALKAALGRRPS